MSRNHWIVVIAFIEWLQDVAVSHTPAQLLAALRAANDALLAPSRSDGV